MDEQEQGEMVGGPDWARRAAERAAQRGGYMAGILRTYREMQGSDEAQLAAELGCPPGQLPLLGLCREPRRDTPRFAADVREIAGFAGADALPLARLIRAVDNLRALSGSWNAAGRSMAAARDAETEGEATQPGLPSERDGDDGGLA